MKSENNDKETTAQPTAGKTCASASQYGRLTVRAARAGEHASFDAQLAQGHYLGAGQPVGDYLRQIVERDGRAVALLAWGPACYALKDRDAWIGWSFTHVPRWP